MSTLLTVVGRCIEAGKKTKNRRKTENEENGTEQTALVSVVADSLYQTEMAYNFAGQTSATTVAR